MQNPPKKGMFHMNLMLMKHLCKYDINIVKNVVL